MRKDIFTEQNGIRTIDIQKVLGKGYNNGWFTNFKGRYRFFVGSRSSKKSQNMLGYEPIIKIIQDDRRNILVVRQNDVDNRTTTFPNLVSCIEDLGLTQYFKTTMQPLEITYKPTGQKIVFKGFNNPTGLQGLKFAHGYLTDIYIDEASECMNYADFLQLDGSMRVDSKTAKDLNIQITCIMNPFVPEHWIFTEFYRGRLEPTEEYMETHKYDDYRDDNFVGPFGRGLYLHESNFKINEFRDKSAWDPAAVEMKKRSPELYKTNFLGLFGATTGLCYPEFSEVCYTSLEEVMKMDILEFAIGIDTGLSNGEGKKITIKKGENPDQKIRSATTMSLVGITRDLNKIVVVDEYFHSNDTSVNFSNTDNRDKLEYPQLIQQCVNYIIKWKNKYGNNRNRGNLLMKGTIYCYVDNADLITPGALQREANNAGLFNVEFIPCTKITIQNRVDFLRLMMAWSNLLVVKDNCPNTIREYKSARKGEKGEARAPGNDHMMDCIDYAWCPFRLDLNMWKYQYKEH